MNRLFIQKSAKKSAIQKSKKSARPLFVLIFLVTAGLGLWAGQALADNVAVSNAVLQNKNLPASTVEVKFDLSQDNPFSGPDGNENTFYDRIWVFVKYWVVGTDSETTGWHHATLISGGTVTPASDGMGAFVQAGTNQVVQWNYGADGVDGGAAVKVRVLAIEMVYIPEGQFVYNAGGIGGSTYNNYGGGSQSTVSLNSHVPGGASAGWPNGYNAFYIAKHEVSQGQYADFLNMITATDGTGRSNHANTTYRNTITYTSGNDYGLRYAAGSPNRGANYLSWDDTRAYTSWAALRPMTEMEFEKAARGGGTGTEIYPWGNTAPSTSTYTFDGATFSQYYVNYNNTSSGPVDVGHYLSGDLTRTNEQTGASPYGVTDFAGNNWEHLINCAWTTTPANGDGALTPPASWPGATSGKGVRGGCWYDSSLYLRVSSRYVAGWSFTNRNYYVGFRAARTP